MSLPPAFGTWPPSPVLALKLYLELWREVARGAIGRCGNETSTGIACMKSLSATGLILGEMKI